MAWKTVPGVLQVDEENDLFRVNLGENVIVMSGDYRPPEEIPFDFDAEPILSIDMTISDRVKFGPNAHIEVWNTDGDTETLINPGTIKKIKTSGVLTSINLPDLNFDFAPTKTGYFLIYK